MNPFIQLAIAIVIVAVVLFSVFSIVGDVMKPNWKQAIYALAALALFLYGLDLFGLYHCSGMRGR
jgi:hypothetical protein